MKHGLHFMLVWCFFLFAGIPHSSASMANFSLAIQSDGSLLAWGDNTLGQLGDGTNLGRATPAPVLDANALPLRGIVAVAPGGDHVLALDGSGGVMAWGGNTSGQLGDGSTLNRNIPRPVIDAYGNPLQAIVAIAAGNTHSLALRSDHGVLQWGSDGISAPSSIPKDVINITGWPLGGVQAIAAGRQHSLVLLADGTVLAWGMNNAGQLGDGTLLSHASPLPVLDAYGQPISGIQAVAAAGDHSFALQADGTLLAWGANGAGELGDGTNLSRSTPVLVRDAYGAPLSGVVRIRTGQQHALALLADGTLRAWGLNANGQLGDGTTASRNTPVMVRDIWGLPLNGVVAIATGRFHSLALLSDGSIWSWGAGALGQLGSTAPADSPTPTPVVDAMNLPLTGMAALMGQATIDHYTSTEAGSFPGYIDGPAYWAQFSELLGMTRDVYGNLFLVDAGNNAIRKLSAGQVTTLNALTGLFLWPSGIAADTQGNLYIADQAGNRIYRVNIANGSATPWAGMPTPGYSDNAAPLLAQFDAPSDVVIDAYGNLFVADQNNHRIRKISANGVVSTYAGNSVQILNPYQQWVYQGGYQDGPAIPVALFHSPTALALDWYGNLYVADTGNHRIRKIDAQTRIVSTVAGTGVAGYADGDALSAAMFDTPQGVSVDAYGNLYVADTGNHRIRKISPTGWVTTISGTGVQASLDGYSSAAAHLFPVGILIDRQGDVLTSDAYRLRRISPIAPIDQIPPVITLLGPNPYIVALGTAYVDPGAMAIDNVDGDISANIVVTGQVNTAALGSYLLRYDVMDAAGNAAAQVVRTVVVVDQTPPVITLLGPNPYTVAAGTAYVDPGAVAIDNVDGDISANIVVTGQVNTAAPGNYLLRYDVMDAAGNAAAQVTRTVVVVDQTPPVITLLGPDPYTVEVGLPYIDPGVIAVDNVDGDITARVQVVNPVRTQAPATFTITYDVSDAAGNAAAQAQRTVHVVDTTPPVIVGVPLGDIYVEALGVSTPYALLAPQAVDAYGIKSVTVDNPGPFPLGVNVVHWTATDLAGLKTIASQRIIVRDTTPPVILGIPLPIVVVEATAISTPVSLTPPTATDLFPVTVTSNAPATYPLGTTLVTWMATDANGQSSTTSQKVVVQDTTPPVFTRLPEDILLVGNAVDGGASLANNARLRAMVNAVAAIDLGIAASMSNDAPLLFANGTTTTLTFTASDASGNRSSASCTVTVNDPNGRGFQALAPSGSGLTIAQSIALGLDPYAATQDADGDGVADIDEVGNPALPRDQDGDGVPDVLEAGALAQDASQASGLAVNLGVVDIYSGGQRISQVSQQATMGTVPAGLVLPYGVLSYTTTSAVGASQPVQLRFSAPLPNGFQVYKIDNAGNYLLLPATAWLQVDANTLQLLLTDGDPMTDLDGLANGVIVDPLAIAATMPPLSSGNAGNASTPATGGQNVSQTSTTTTTNNTAGGCSLYPRQSEGIDPLLPLLLWVAVIHGWRRRWL